MKRILVVEDDVIICGGVKLFLEKRDTKLKLRTHARRRMAVWNMVSI